MNKNTIKNFIREVLLESETSNDKSKLALSIHKISDDRIVLTLYRPDMIITKLNDELKNWTKAGGADGDYDLYDKMGEIVINEACIAAHLFLAKPKNPCNGALEVIGSAGEAGTGLGRYLYSIAMNLSKKGLVSDRDSVSSGAQKVWKNFFANGIDKQKLDNVENPQTPDKSDDCKLHKDSDFLNYSYLDSGVDGGPNESIHQQTIVKIVQMLKPTELGFKGDGINNMIVSASQRFFTKRFNE